MIEQEIYFSQYFIILFDPAIKENFAKQGIQDVVANLAKEELKIATKQGLKVFEEHNKLE